VVTTAIPPARIARNCLRPEGLSYNCFDENPC